MPLLHRPMDTPSSYMYDERQQQDIGHGYMNALPGYPCYDNNSNDTEQSSPTPFAGSDSSCNSSTMASPLPVCGTSGDYLVLGPSVETGYKESDHRDTSDRQRFYVKEEDQHRFGLSHQPACSSDILPSTFDTSMLTRNDMQIRILGIPESGAKSRVETQIKLCVQLLTSQGTKVPQWSFVRLPEFMLARSKLRKTQQRKQLANKLGVVDCDESKVLSLSATVFCVSDPERKLRMCAGCVRRERKRAERKKDSHLTEEALLSAMSDDAFEKERDRILLFNCEPLVNFSSGDAILPTRITCYCRHHNERVGFRIRFALQDCSGTTVASGETPPIMITDDHKSTKQGPVAGRKRRRTEYALATPASSRRNSLCIDGDETSTQYQPSLFHQPFMDDQYSLESSPLPTPAEEQTSSVFGNDNTAAPWCVIPERPLPSTIENNLGLTTAAVSSSQQVAMLHQEHPNPLTTMIPNMNITTPVTTPIDSPSSYAPRVDRLVPNNGPVYGGCEITILGANFRTGLTCLFGDRPAITLCWSPSTLVCVLPASTHPGPVVVSFKEHPLVVDGNDITLFTYYDTSDHALMELALQVVGLKMTGKLQDPKQVAMGIVQGDKQQQTVVGHTNTEQRVMNALEAVQVDDVSIINAQGHSLLHLAVLCGYRRLVHLLMSNGTSNIHAQDRTGMSALQMALWKGDGQVTEMLLQRTPLSTSASCLSLSDRARPSSLRRFHSFQHTASKVQGSDMDENGLGFAKQKHDQRLYAFWLPLLLVTFGLLCCQLIERHILSLGLLVVRS